jgi:hypothetical protein
MPMIDHRPPRDDPPEGGGPSNVIGVLNMTVELAGGAQGAVGAPRFGRGGLPTSTKG